MTTIHFSRLSPFFCAFFAMLHFQNWHTSCFLNTFLCLAYFRVCMIRFDDTKEAQKKNSTFLLPEKLSLFFCEKRKWENKQFCGIAVISFAQHPQEQKTKLLPNGDVLFLVEDKHFNRQREIIARSHIPDRCDCQTVLIDTFRSFCRESQGALSECDQFQWLYIRPKSVRKGSIKYRINIDSDYGIIRRKQIR